MLQRPTLTALETCTDQMPSVEIVSMYGGAEGTALRNAVDRGVKGGGKTVADAGAVMADDLSPQKVRILLMLSLQNGVSSQADLQAAFDK